MIKTKCFAIWPKSKDLYPTYLKASKPPSIWGTHLVTTKHVRQVTRIARLAYKINFKIETGVSCVLVGNFMLVNFRIAFA